MTANGPIYRDLINRGARAHSDRVAMIVNDKAYSFTEVDDRANQLARALITAGATKGTRIAVLLNNGVDSMPVDFALSKAGLNKVPLNARLSLDEHIRMVEEAQCTIVLFGADLTERATELINAIPDLMSLGMGVTLPGGRDLAHLATTLPTSDPDVSLSADDIIITLYTSGTTGTLKAAQHTQRSYAAICRNILLNLFPINRDTRMLHAASLIHASGTFVLPFWLRGACSVILPGFSPETYLSTIARHRVTSVNLVPTMLQMLIDHPAFDAHDITSLQHIVYGASPMPRPLITRAIAKLGQERFWQYFGQTEAPLCIAVLRPEDHVSNRLGACGQPAIDVELKLVDDLGNDVGAGPGEVTLRSATAAAGYFNADDLTAATFDSNGWVHTRDVGQFDADGFLYLLDRTSDMIITGGYNVYPREVEDALLSHPAVTEAAVVGAPDDKWVEAVVAFVVLRDVDSVGERALIVHVADQIASYKKPHRIEFVDALPKTVIGKLDRKTLRSQLRAATD